MHHLNLVSQHGPATGMTAKNLAIVWAPNLLRATPAGSTPTSAHYSSQASRVSDQNLQDIAVQAACTEFLIEYCELLFSEKLPVVSLTR